MARRGAGISWTLLLTLAVWLAGGRCGLAQAAAEAGAAGSAANSAGGAARGSGGSIGSALGRIGAKVEESTSTAIPVASTGANRAKSPGAAPRSTQVSPMRTPAGKDGAPVVTGPPPHIHFDVVSFKRCSSAGSSDVDLPADGDYVAYHCQPLSRMISFAYSGAATSNINLSGYPSWVETDLYDFAANVAAEDLSTWQKMGPHAQKAAVRGLLTDRLRLKIHVDTTQKPETGNAEVEGL
jgi:hypothetical protein